MTDTWRTVEWSLGANDKYGDCAFVCLANLLDLWAAEAGTPFTIGEAECLFYYNKETGFLASNPASDKGAVLETVICDWCRDGWPADPINKPASYRGIGNAEIAAAIERNGGVPCWAMLPAGDDLDPFGDDKLADDPQDGHAMLAVAATDDGLMLVTWAETVEVSWRWWERFGRGQFEVMRP